MQTKISFWLLLAYLVSGFGFKASLADEKISYTNDVLPIFQSRCYGCHQNANKLGDFDLTNFESLLRGGESGDAAIVPGEPENSYLLQLIQPDEDGNTEMPIDADPLSADQVQTIRRWIKEGAVNDFKNQGPQYSTDSPPTYTRLPTITTVDFSADGNWFAVSGFNEVLVFDAKEFKLRKRLIGLSQRIERIRFSPDSSRIAVAGGTPGSAGEIQVWNIAEGSLSLSRIVGGDCAFGVNWSPDGKLLSFGLTDTTVRVIDSVTGKQELFQSAHDDWVRDSVFSVDGKRLVSVGRDTTCKLIDVETERFIDNLTSITPAILKGGISSIARHPNRDEVVIGCADGIVKVYRMDRQTKRVIGDDANLIRRLPKLDGRVESVDISHNGTRILAGSSLDGKGEVRLFGYEFDSSLTEELKAILRKLPSQWNKNERKKIEDYWSDNIKEYAQIKFDTGIYATSFNADGSAFAVAGADGLVRVFETANNKLLTEFAPIQNLEKPSTSLAAENWRFESKKKKPSRENDYADVQIESLSVLPERIEINSKTGYAQIVVMAELKNGSMIDVTEFAKFSTESPQLLVDQTGLLQLENANRSK